MRVSSFYIGHVFDVIGDYKRTSYKMISANVVEESFQVDIRNHKDKPVDVKCIEHVWSDWTVTQTSHKFNKKDVYTLEFPGPSVGKWRGEDHLHHPNQVVTRRSNLK